MSWPVERPLPLDSLVAATGAALGAVRGQGYYFAALDSVTVDSTSAPPEVVLYVDRGAEVRVGELRFEGLTVLDEGDLRRLMETRPGRSLDRRQLEADLDVVLARYEARGYPLVQLRIADIRLLPGEPPALAVTIEVDEGRTLTLERVEVRGGERTRPGFAARLAGLRPGQPLTNYAPEEIRRRLAETLFFEEVGAPELRLVSDSSAVLVIPVTEEPPGVFDLVLGYLPPASGQGRGALVGNGHLELQNLFGSGRELAVRLNRLPGQVSSVDVHVADPYVFGLPFSMEGQFSGLQQDSTYGKQQYRAEVGYLVGRGLTAVASYSREATRPGQHGLEIVNQRQRIARATAGFGGVGLRYRRLDRSVNPGRGLLLEMNLESGRKERYEARVVDGDTSDVGSVLRQQRLQVDARLYVPALARQVLVLGGDAALLLSEVYDRSDLFRFGGATSLRGYNEDQFLGRTVARALVEYRYQIDRQSYAFLFFDLGYVDAPGLDDGTAAVRRLYPGYGLGMQFSTGLGLMNVSAALNPEDGPTAMRIHAGLSFGL